ncbi:hypothetical protein ACIFOC_02824 [Leucobacter aridicollis]|uniref:TIGR02611 family protein n=1 Tax=Leucobacter aridicollis TaxID=283878 RepID=UPI000F0F1504|nr:TIGR02611 family protein [Leucobacter aridicollis]MCS3429158.1 uncharacterized protein (TIGR02611 family) [Leucobacter aridicollis]RKQ85758.1 uncharacterized protein (TIGR02611 family) [Mycolicibacterium mucogenicum 261Sha1.1M5]
MTRPEDDADKARRLGKPIGRFMARWRGAIRKYPWLDALYRVVITVLGGLIVIIGLILVPLPGPGWLIVFLGLTVLGSEYHWARRMLGWLRRALARFWERWNAWRASRAAKRAGASGPGLTDA